jgi:hypothetical protein
MKASGVGHLMCMEEIRNAYTIFIGECEWKRPHGRLGRIFYEQIFINIG